MYSIGQFRFDRDDVDAALVPVPRDQPLDPLSPGQVIPMAAAFEVFLHETPEQQLDRYGTPAVPATAVNGIEARPAARRQLAGLVVAASPFHGNVVFWPVTDHSQEIEGVVVASAGTTTTGLQFDLLCNPQGIFDFDTIIPHAAFQLGMSE